MSHTPNPPRSRHRSTILSVTTPRSPRLVASRLFARKHDVHGVRLAGLGRDVRRRQALEPPREVVVCPNDPDVIQIPRRGPDRNRLGGEAPVAERHHLLDKVLTRTQTHPLNTRTRV